ncbi:rna-directed dna polymerase from mobile element jockey-like [Willisornis vidua]|uniref:Rna-directed dna polymerase from mobile element jockey-like n=1 Tax=Willisornis vidua TaxID=1566151 RepID=A0ABQ9DKE1_9PASS|nr:rna-directed dna polymerase from mobile element jockey-like [Willisornis vidua]
MISSCVCAVDSPEGRDAIQRDLDKFERWPFVDLMKFNKDKCNVLHLGLDNTKYKYSLAKEQTESSPMIVLIDEKHSMTWQCALAAQKANNVLGSTKRSVMKITL